MGDSAIVDPEGKFIAGPLHEKEGVLFAEIDPAAMAGRWMLDVAGHYARPDVFQLTVTRKAKPVIGESAAGGAGARPRPAARTKRETPLPKGRRGGREKSR